MQLIRMSFKDFTFMVNPESLKISHTKSVSSKLLPFGSSKNKEMNTNPVVISGVGYSIGENARKNIRFLTRVFNDKGSGYLYLPDSTPIKVIFSKLDVKYSGVEDKVEYEFEFLQESCGKAAVFDFGFTYALQGENLYDIANRTSKDVGELFCLNKYSDLFSVKEGDKVWLR